MQDEAIIHKLFTDGTHRSAAPAETLARVRPLLRRFGITRIANVTGLDCIGIDTVMVVRPNARSLSVAQGKGVDLDAAKASGVMEAIEQHAAEHVRRPLVSATADELRRAHRVVDTAGLPRLQQPFGPSERILWTEGRDLATGEAVQVPYELVHCDFTLPLPPGSGHFLASTSGLASGNDPLEAFVHGICELIERDAMTLFYGASAEEQWRRRVDLDAVEDPVCGALLERYDDADVEVACWDMTSDVGVPSFLCGVIDRQLNPFRPVGLARGAGCHPVAEIALSRALCEAAQSRLTRIAGTRDDMAQAQVARAQSEETLARHLAEIVPTLQPPRRFSDVPTHPHPTFEEDLAWLRARLASAGMSEIVVVDLTPAELPASVVRIVIPGLEASCEIPGYRPGARAAARPPAPGGGA
jgi:ribosomal protein S12 methylthiotransferase accessory factor